MLTRRVLRRVGEINTENFPLFILFHEYYPDRTFLAGAIGERPAKRGGPVFDLALAEAGGLHVFELGVFLEKFLVAFECALSHSAR